MKALIAALLCGVAASAQEVVWERTGGLDQYELGRRCQFIGDVDGDGYDDLVTSVRRVVGTPPRSHVDDELWILSGRDGSTLRTRGRYNTGDADRDDYWLYGGYGAAGDMDRDGRPDYFFGAWESSGPLARYIIEVRDGRDDRLILRFVRSSSSSSPNFLLVNLLGHDLNGDGHTDLIGRARGPQHLGLVQAYSHTGTLLWETHGTNQLQFDTFDGNEAWVGDVDGDGVHDFVVGGYDRIADALAAVVLSGRTGQPVVVGHSALYYGTLGYSLDGCGDVDGDGVPDFAGSGVSSPARSSVQLFSGRTGARLGVWLDGAGGYVRSGGADFDRDGVPDLLFPSRGEPLSGGGFGGAHTIVSGRDGRTIMRLNVCGTSGPNICPGLQGYEVGRARPGDLYPVFVIPEPYYGASGYYFNQGRIRVLRSNPVGVEPYGSACAGRAGTSAKLGMSELWSLDADRSSLGLYWHRAGARINLSNAPSNVPAVLLLGLSNAQWLGRPLPLSLTPWGLPGCALFTSIEAVATVTTGSAGIARGFAAINLPLPLQAPNQSTLALHGQWLLLTPGQAPSLGALSDAARWHH